MDLIHRPDTKSWIYQKKINVKEFLSRFVFEIDLSKEIEDAKLNNLIENDTELNDNLVRKLSSNCSINKLDAKEEKDFYYFYRSRDYELNEFDQLETLNARRNNLRLFKNHAFYRFRVLDKQKYRTNYITFNIKENELNKNEDERINDFECLLTVQIFNPISSNNYKELKHNNFIMHEYHVLGSQTLVKLKDIYQCVSDLMSPVDCSQNPDISKSLNKAEDYTSSFFFINDCFYVDTRLPTNIDYSE